MRIFLSIAVEALAIILEALAIRVEVTTFYAMAMHVRGQLPVLLQGQSLAAPLF